ncbi:MAG: hypothetical protein ACYDBA_00055 [Sulfuricaulis sp.]
MTGLWQFHDTYTEQIRPSLEFIDGNNSTHTRPIFGTRNARLAGGLLQVKIDRRCGFACDVRAMPGWVEDRRAGVDRSFCSLLPAL